MRLLFLLLLVGPFVGFSQKITERNFKKYFDEYGVKGSFLLFDLKRNQYVAYDDVRCREGFLPASTFKIPNTVIGLETGVIADTSFVIKWDGVKRGISAWNRDHTLASAMRVSAVPYYQELARRVGVKRYQKILPKLKFGQMDAQANNVDRFWLEGRSRITQYEQIDFLKRLYLNELPVSRRSMDLTKDILLLDEKPGYKLWGKTGWSNDSKDPSHANNGWFVGWLQHEGNTCFFAINVDFMGEDTARFVASRRGIAEKILREMKLM
ncbi:MAG: class D beta-lactamase [Cytophagaceae bacterium]|nr:class D beta-lactamase [Cytophagaceae bacterium]